MIKQADFQLCFRAISRSIFRLGKGSLFFVTALLTAYEGAAQSALEQISQENVAERKGDSATRGSVEGRRAVSPGFEVPPGIQPAVDFWVLVFTKYGKHQVVFHHRKEPSIVYSVLDFKEMSETLLPGEYERKRKSEVGAESERIRSILLRLASGAKAESPFESRIERMFRSAGFTNLRSAYRDAASEELLRSQTGIRERFSEGLIRSRRYLYAIEQIFKELDLPVELGRLPLVESSFDYTAYSSVGAAGIWQFMRGTAKRYMQVDAIIDERRDPIMATRGAAQYLKRAYDVLGAWPLAVTSYNHGVSGVMRASKEVGTKDLALIIKRYEGPAFGFASKNFFPSFLAALEVERNWRRYFPELKHESPWYFDEVRLGGSLSFRELVSLSGVSSERAEDLNRALLKPITSGRSSIPAGTIVKVPVGAGQRVIARVKGSSLIRLTHIPPQRKVVEVRQKIAVKKNTAKKVASKSSAPKKKAKPAPVKKPAKGRAVQKKG